MSEKPEVETGLVTLQTEGLVVGACIAEYTRYINCKLRLDSGLDNVDVIRGRYRVELLDGERKGWGIPILAPADIHLTVEAQIYTGVGVDIEPTLNGRRYGLENKYDGLITLSQELSTDGFELIGGPCFLRNVQPDNGLLTLGIRVVKPTVRKTIEAGTPLVYINLVESAKIKVDM